MAIDAVEKGFAELLGYLAYTSAGQDFEVEDIEDELVKLLETYMERKQNA